MNKIKIMIVDDTFFMRETIKRFIDLEEFDLIEGKNGEEAVKLYKEHNPYLVSMDITMPIMDGMEALKKIIEFDKNALVMMSTAIGQKVFVKECIQYGATNYIVKPFNKKSFMSKIEDLIKTGISSGRCPYESKECNKCKYIDNCQMSNIK